MIEWMDMLFLGNPIKTWLAALGAMIVAFVGLWVL
jgi:hypothetical protein